MITVKYILLALAGVSVPGQLPVKLYTTVDGLPRNVVNCILQDSRGFLWLGTTDGLAQFDGQRFTIYTSDHGLPDGRDINVGIGTTAPEHRLHVVSNSGYAGYFEGNVHVAGRFTFDSDIRMKEEVKELGYGLREVMQLRPVSWRWRNRADTQPILGLLAQEVKPVLPELVDETSNGKLGIQYMGLVPVLIKAIQEQKAAMDGRQAEIEALKLQNASLEARLAALERMMGLLWAQVKNSGSIPMPADAAVWFNMDGPSWSGSHWVGLASIGGLASGANRWYSYTWSVPNNVPSGAYTYKAQAWTSSAISDLSSGTSFSVGSAGPVKTTLISPSGTIRALQDLLGMGARS